MDWYAFTAAVVLCLAAAGAEGALSGRDLPGWLASLRRPRLYAPMWVWVIVAALTYVLQGFIAYRLLVQPWSASQLAALGALIAVMGANVAYNVVLDRTRDPQWTYRGLLWFLPPLLVLQGLLLHADPLSGWLHLAYLAWVAGYDLPVMKAVAQLNRGRK